MKLRLLGWLVVGILIYLSGAIFQLWFFGTPESMRYTAQTVYSPFMQLFSYAMYGSALVLILSHAKRVFGKPKALSTAWLMVLYILLSALWAIDGAASFAEWKVIFLGFVFGVYVARSLAPAHILSILVVFYGAVVIAGLFFAVRYPYLGTYMGADGSWRGAFGDRNEMAMHSNLALASFMALWAKASKRWVRYGVALPLMAIAVLLIVQSNSATGLIAMLMLAALNFMLPLLRKNTAKLMMIGIPLAIIAAILAGVVMANSDSVLKMLGKDPTLTGRTEIWQEFLEASAKQPLFGYGGQKVFVRSGNVMTHSFYDVSAGASYAYAAHNMYLSMLLKYGAVGMLIFAWMLIRMLRTSFTQNAQNNHALATWPLMALMVLLLFGGSLTIDNMGIVWFYFALISASGQMGMPPVMTNNALVARHSG